MFSFKSIFLKFHEYYDDRKNYITKHLAVDPKSHRHTKAPKAHFCNVFSQTHILFKYMGSICLGRATFVPAQKWSVHTLISWDKICPAHKYWNMGDYFRGCDDS